MKAPYTCYCCEGIGNTNEHAPPKSIYPKQKYLSEGSPDYRKNLITVPSCKKHNNDKSGDDEYLLALFTLSIPESKIAEPMMKKWIEAFKRNDSLAKRIFSLSRKITILTQKNNLLIPEKTFAITAEKERINNAMKSTVRALYYHESKYKNKWLNDFTVTSPNFLNQNLFIDVQRQEIYRDFFQAFANPNIIKKGPHHDIFFYQMLEEGLEGACVMKLVFYNHLVFFALLV
ncbi:hypothetical protein [Nostoc sp. UHCC 0251]|uniref:hypothetical protein n=1 Tax=Nostoc sp. UHCC 0251 TaxID=3110240 RepID=UPI002B1FAB5B|nr:hypothetical protein [Nostoc sp. UHCC 0251]MEA5622418.1 hypothetical protein [Nostoc sp. UHCC 0251]